MAVYYDENTKTISIDTQHTTYQMKIGPYGVLLHSYYGNRTSNEDMSYPILLIPSCPYQHPPLL